ncbi:MAG: Crp/Fnr family transcriptional regulator [bacterium]
MKPLDDLLRKSPLFAGFSEQDMRDVERLAIVRECEKGKTLFCEGDPARHFFVLLSGKLKLYKLSADGRQHIMHLISPGEDFAIAAVYVKKFYPAYAEAMTDSAAAAFRGDEFLRLIERKPRLAINIIISLSSYLHGFTQMIEDLALKEVSARLARYLLGLAETNGRQTASGTEITLDVRKTQLAARLGTVSETLSRTLKKMKQRGIIKTSKNRVLILDRRTLDEISKGKKL